MKTPFSSSMRNASGSAARTCANSSMNASRAKTLRGRGKRAPGAALTGRSTGTKAVSTEGCYKARHKRPGTSSGKNARHAQVLG